MGPLGLHRFAQAYPDISLNLSAAHTPSDFALGQSDIDLRYGVPQWGDLVVEPLFEERIVPLASPAQPSQGFEWLCRLAITCMQFCPPCPNALPFG